jgi:hypothetical protein
MAALLPTILSDDEESALISKKESKSKGKKSKKEVVAGEDTDDESKASSGDEMDGDFEFGGMLVSYCGFAIIFAAHHSDALTFSLYSLALLIMSITNI